MAEAVQERAERLPGEIICDGDGYLVVAVGGGAQMACPTTELEHRLRYDDPDLVAASVIDSFRYLVMDCTKEEAWRRIRLMRLAMNGKSR